MKIREDSRAGRDRFLRPFDNAESGLAAGSPCATEPEERNSANNAPEGEPDLQENQASPAAPDPESEPVSLRPVRPAERRAQEFLPQWLKRQGRAWPG